MSAGPRQCGQLLPNDTMNRTADRTCTQKLTNPTLEKQDQTNASMWWKKFVQNIKLTKDIDLSTITNSKEILPQYRDQLEADIKNIFFWAVGQKAITEMTKTVREREPSSLPLHKLYTLFTLHPRKERTPKWSRFLRLDTGRQGNRSRRVETDTRSREKLRIRNNYRSRTSVEIFVTYR